MRYYSYPSESGPRRLIARGGTNSYDLTEARDELRTFADLVRTAAVVDDSLDDVARSVLDDASNPDLDGRVPDLPLVPDEVWAAGVTYRVSEEARREESDMSEFYVNVYEADRPEIFFKATPSRTVGPGDPVGIRGDSSWDVPEPELGAVLYQGDIVGYTVGNDVSSRAIEGANPLYLPQAKVYEGCCALGPAVVSADAIDPYDQTITMRIDRDETVLFEESVSTAQMVRTYEELAEYFCRHDVVPEFAVLLGGTSIVPPEEFTLRKGDTVRITADGIGTLENTVELV